MLDIDTNGDGTVDYSLAAETFYWKVGTITTYELALSYYVYLTDAMSGKEAGSYPTNESAVLYYTNYLGKEDCYKTTVSPVLAWKAANVSYAFYLVNSDGQPVNANGDVVTFANKVTIVNPTLYKEVLLNSAGGGNVNSLNIVANNSNVLPTGYTLYDYNAEYTVIINSDATGSWSINNSKTVASTYVTDYSSTEQYTNATSSTSESDAYDYTHTTVWFAVVWEPQALPDTVVIDYGLPVDIHVLTNDMFGDYGKLLGVAKGDVKEGTSQSFNGVSSTTVDGEYGTATVNVPTAGANESNSVVRYTPEDMEMNSYDKFTYSVQYANSNYTQNNGYYYETVTVIPATTIYYEDSFVDYTSYTWDYDGDPEGWINSNGLWKSVTDETYVDDADITQDEDRPGNVNYAFDTVIDANNVYGYDSAYTECSQYSLGSAMMAHVDYDNMAEASFVFYGTGFDVVSMTSNQTGAITVEVFAADENGNKTGDAIRSHSVDTYYGYTYDEASGEWVTSINDPNALYQVPVMEIAGLDYSKYYVEIQVVYDQIFDHSQYSDKTFDFYLDAIRIYDPANDGVADNTADTTDKDDVTIENAYEADKESWPIYQELRNNVIEAAEITSEGIEEINGIVFIDSVDETAAVADYESVGPNNELYLSNGQAIAFNLDLSAYDTENVSSVQLGIKSVGGETTYKIFDGSKIANQNDLANVANTTISTATGMYYDITALSDKTIVICNTGDSILSITDLKITFKSNPGVVESLVYVNVTAVKSIIKSMNNDGSFVPTKFEVSVPQSVTVGKSIVVKVTTSSDVLTVSINGMMLNSYSKNADGSYTWTTSIKTTDEGTESIKVIAYNADGTASASETVEVKVNSVAETVTNTAKSIVKNVISWLSKLLS